MQKRTVRASGLKVNALGLGGMSMSLYYGSPKEKSEMTELLRATVERGSAFFETAEVYRHCHNEVIVEEAL
jgi:aryl-alcohol dehydrogenase-like predicted oxidoreductase